MAGGIWPRPGSGSGPALAQAQPYRKANSLTFSFFIFIRDRPALAMAQPWLRPIPGPFPARNRLRLRDNITRLRRQTLSEQDPPPLLSGWPPRQCGDHTTRFTLYRTQGPLEARPLPLVKGSESWALEGGSCYDMECICIGYTLRPPPLNVAECFSERHASHSRRRGRGGRRLRRAMKLTCAVKLYSVGSSSGARANPRAVGGGCLPAEIRFCLC